MLVRTQVHIARIYKQARTQTTSTRTERMKEQCRTTISTNSQTASRANGEALRVYLCWCSIPNGTNLDKLKLLAGTGREQREAVRVIFTSVAWTEWRAAVAVSLQEVAASLQKDESSVIDDWNTTILEQFNRYADSKCIQAKILSMMFRCILRTEDDEALINTICASPTVHDTPHFIHTICSILSAPDAIRLCQSAIYTDVMELVSKLLYTQEFARVRLDEIDTYYANTDTVLDACFAILNKIYYVQHLRSTNTLSLDPTAKKLRAVQTLVGAERQETKLQAATCSVMRAILSLLHIDDIFENDIFKQKVSGILQERMGQILSLDKLLSQDGVVCTDNPTRERSLVVTQFLHCYRDVYDAADNAEEMAMHDRLALYLQEAAQVILTRAYDERFSPLAHASIIAEFTRFDYFLATLEEYGRPTKTMAVQILPILVHCMHCYPQIIAHPTHARATKILALHGGFKLMDTICKLAGEAHQVAEVQQCIVTNLILRIQNKNVVDISMDMCNTGISMVFDSEWTNRCNTTLCSFVDIILQNPILRGTFCITLLLKTRLFDLLATTLSRVAIVEGDRARLLLDPAYVLNPILRVLERKPYQRDRGMVDFSIASHPSYDTHGQLLTSTDYTAEYPGVDSTTTVSSTMLEHTCRRFDTTETLVISGYSYKIYNMATALKAVLMCDRATMDNRNVSCKILALFTKSNAAIAPEIGSEWLVSPTAPPGMFDRENIEANRLLASALDHNPMLRNALMSGCVTFSASDWREMSEKQALFVPSNSLVFQRGLSGRGTVQIGSKFFQPVARGSMQNLLGSKTVSYVLAHLWLILEAAEEVDTSQEGVIYRSLVFIQGMLDHIMDIECCVIGQTSLVKLLARLLTKTSADTAVCEITCHLMSTLTTKLDIPLYENAASESPVIVEDAHRRTLVAGDPLLFVVVQTNMDASLFELLRSTPQDKGQQCRTISYACTILMHMYKMRGAKYSCLNRQQNIEPALTRACRNIDDNAGFTALDLHRRLMRLLACCE